MDGGQRERESERGENKTEIAPRETKRRSMRCKVSRVSHQKTQLFVSLGEFFQGRVRFPETLKEKRLGGEIFSR